MRNRFKKSSRPTSFGSTKSNSSTPQKGVGADTAHNRAPSAPGDLAKPSPADDPQASVESRAMGISSDSIHDEKPIPSTPASASLLQKTHSIRTVTNADDRPRLSSDDDLSSDTFLSATRHSNSTFSSSVNSAISSSSSASQSQQGECNKSPSSQLKQSTSVQTSASLSPNTSSAELAAHTGSPQAMPTRSGVDNSQAVTIGRPLTKTISGSSSTQASAAVAMVEDRQGDDASANGWDSTVGKAGLGKTGRVINRLVSDNEALKRELKLERLKADESRQAAKLLEDKMERMVSEYESRLLEASVVKTLLARKERQVESLQGAVDLEKQRTTDAKNRERIWRDEMEKIKKESKQQVEEATAHAALMEGRYNAISSHWRDQGITVKQAMGRMATEVKELAEARRQDDDKISTLRDVCDQQDGNIRVLWQQKEDIARKFEEYKQEQEAALHDIKSNAAKREAQQEQTLEEARQVLDKLRWALNVKKNIDWAE